MVAQFYTCLMVKKYIHPAVHMLIYLLKDLNLACGNVHQKGCNLWVLMKWWKWMEGCVTQKWVALSHNTWGAEDGGGCLRYLCFVCFYAWLCWVLFCAFTSCFWETKLCTRKCLICVNAQIVSYILVTLEPVGILQASIIAEQTVHFWITGGFSAL